MGGSTSKLKRWMGSGEEDGGACEKAVKRLATPFVYTRRGSMFLDEDGDVAHEFYEEVPPLRRGVKATMKRILTNLTPQGDKGVLERKSQDDKSPKNENFESGNGKKLAMNDCWASNNYNNAFLQCINGHVYLSVTDLVVSIYPAALYIKGMVMLHSAN